MKTTVNISVSGISFLFEQDAYLELENYMASLHNAYGENAEGKEIINDIEARIAELILSWQSAPNTVVTRACIDHIIEQLGMPEESAETAKPKGTAGQYENNAIPDAGHIGKRLYRNTDGAKLGGVLNGIASYYNTDVAIVRLVWIIVFCLGFFWWQEYIIPIMSTGYILLWIIIPRAKTPRQKLEMQGEKITVSSIQDNLRQELDNRYKNPKNSESASLFANFIYGIGKILRFLLMIILAVIAIAIALPLVGAFVLMFFLLVNGTAGVALFSLLNPFWAIILSALSVIIPLGFSLYVLIVILFSLKWSRIFIIAVLAVWAVIWAITGAFATRDILQYSVPRKIAEDITLEQAPDTLHLQPLITGENGSPLYIYNDDDLSFNNNFDNIRKNISFKIRESHDSTYHIAITKSARGTDSETAIDNARKIAVDYQLKGDTLYLSPSFPITKEMKYRAQEAEVILYCPKNSILKKSPAWEQEINPKKFHKHRTK